MRILFWAWPRLDISGPRIAAGDSTNIFVGGGIHSYADIAKYAKTNTGNYIHLDAPSRFLDYDPAASMYYQPKKPMTEADWRTLIEDANTNFDAVAISYANSLRPDADGSGHAKFIKGLETKICLFGLGLQDWFEPGLDNVGAGMKRFLEIADQKAALWAVRGERTSSWLQRSGIRSAVATGCPSLYSFPQKILSLAKKYAALKDAPQSVLDSKILTAGHLQRGRLQDQTKFWRARDLSDIFKGCVVDYVFQGENYGYHKLKDEEFLYDPTTCELNAEIMNAYFRNNFNFSPSFRKYLFFFDPSIWRVTASHYDVYIGDRLHGGIACMQAGTPSIMFYDDDRVKEIADYFLIPNYPMKQLAGKTLTEVVTEAMADFDADRFVQNYLTRLTDFVALIEGSGLSLRKHVTETLKRHTGVAATKAPVRAAEQDGATAFPAS